MTYKRAMAAILTKKETNIWQVHKTVTQILANNDINTASLDARILICKICDISYEHFIAFPEKIISEEKIHKLELYINRRLSGEPVSRIIGVREFWGMPFALNEATLDPRADTETLIEFVIELLKDQTTYNEDIRILDIGTGTGCVILSLLSEFKNAMGVGIDISHDALKIAKQNAEKLNLSNRVEFIQSNWLDSICGRFDIIVSNPPYIPTDDINTLMPEVRKYDPLAALDGGIDGLDAYRTIISQINEKLSDFRFIVFEIGKDQDKCVKNILMSYKSLGTFSNISYKCDLNRIKRCIAITKEIKTF